jgi:SOS-response transcriptional repressor LexA
MENKQIRLINLRRLLKEAKSAASLAIAANTSPAYLSQILSNKTKGRIGDKLARKLEEALGKPRGWLDVLHENANAIHASVVKFIPIIELDTAMQWCGDGKGISEKAMNLTDTNTENKQIFCIEMQGDSMVSAFNIASSICPGDRVIIDTTLEPSLGDIVLVKMNNSIKIRQLAADGNERILQPFNPQYSIIPYTDEVQVLGVVAEIRRIMHKNQKIGPNQSFAIEITQSIPP